MDILAINKQPSAKSTDKNDDLIEMCMQINGLTSQFTKLMATMKQGQQ